MDSNPGKGDDRAAGNAWKPEAEIVEGPRQNVFVYNSLPPNRTDHVFKKNPRLEGVHRVAQHIQVNVCKWIIKTLSQV